MRAALLVAFVAITYGCAHTDSFESSMNRQIDVLTYDDAIQTWGPPSSEAEGDRVIVARWEKTTGANTLRTRPYSFTGVRSEVLTIAFGKEMKRMISWSLE